MSSNTETIMTFENNKLIKVETRQKTAEEIAFEVEAERKANILNELDGLKARITDLEAKAIAK